MQPQTNHTFALFPPPFFCCLHHVILVCPKIRYRRIHSFIPIFPAKACISMDVLQLQSRPNNVASWLVVRFAIMIIKKKKQRIILYPWYVWKFHYCVERIRVKPFFAKKTCLREKLNIVSGKHIQLSAFAKADRLCPRQWTIRGPSLTQ